MQPFKISKFRGGLAVTFYDTEGKRRRYTLSAKNKKDATPEAVEIVKEFFKKPSSQITLDDIFEAYAKSLGDRPTARRLTKTQAIRKFFGPYKPNQITEDLVMKYQASRVHYKTQKPIKVETLWTELGTLRDALNYARKRRMIPAEDVPFIPRPSKPAPRDRPLTRKEVAQLLHAAKTVPHLYIAILLLLGTAGRVSAILELEWKRIDFENDTIDLRVESNSPRKGRAIVPMNAGLKNELLEWRNMSDCNRVVAFNDTPIKSIKTAFNAAVKRAGLTNVRIHDIRHTAAVWMLESGSTIQRISQYLGHSSIQQTFKVYARYQPDFLRAEAAALDVTPMLQVDASPKEKHSDVQISSKVVSSNNTHTSITVDRRAEPEFAFFIEENADVILDELRQKFRNSHKL
ncbi:site-specific integrase [Celeribacter halophilus]|uniref:tyrosine-type recombinase/integrase n=1 Tax=Celeribacter halophilus TaxID=576117 RepID=UPI002FD031E7